MVLAEVPLWVSHGGNPPSADSNGARTLPGMGFAAPSNANNNSMMGVTGNNNSQQSIDQAAAKSALSLLSSTRGSGRAPMYSVDVHPDGTRFATAAGDGTVKIWSTSSLFDGALNENEGKKFKGKKKKRKGPTSKYTESGNYISSQSEDYESSSSEEQGGNYNCGQSSPPSKMPQQMRQPPPPGTPQAGVNDLSGLVRKKKGGVAIASPPKQATSMNPFTTNANIHTGGALNGNNNNNNQLLSPLSRLTQDQRPANGNDSAAFSISSAANNINQKKHHKLLSTISHQGSILSLRFSPSGTYLATAGDDSYVNIYVRSNTASLAKGNLVGVGADGSKSAGGAGDTDVEHWNRIAICRGHHLDVVGLTWAPDESHLVSCSLDSANPVVVWRLFDVLGKNTKTNGNNSPGAYGTNMGATTLGFSGTTNAASSVHVHNLHPFKVLGRGEHTSTVKGVAFDPAGRYLATSGDDPAVCIFRAYDDWGLEARIDSSSGVFRSKKRKRATNGSPQDEMEEDDPGELASLTLFRRISFAPDGSHVCGTNATLRGKNIAAMISRDGWVASGPSDGKGDGRGKKPPPGAANLVGHKQPVVASRHCPVFFAVPKRGGEYSSEDESDSDDPDIEPEYATLVALGDKRGYVTIWSTKSTRPLFKMQCSESRCTVTDISWGVVRHSKQGENGGGDSLVMIVSLLDGYVVALHFSIPTEVGGGPILSSDKTKRVFQLKYGIEDFVGSYCFSPGKKQRKPKRLVDDAGPLLIENALQLTMEAEANEGVESQEASDADGKEKTASKQAPNGSSADTLGGGNIKDKQMETSNKGGKKRIRPVLMSVSGGVTNVSDEENNGDSEKKRQKKISPSDPLQNALHAASEAVSAAESVTAQAANQGSRGHSTAPILTQAARPSSASQAAGNDVESLGAVSVRIPYSTSKILSVELSSKPSSTSMMTFPLNDNDSKIIADCTNTTSSGVPSFLLTISRGGTKKWKDIIVRSNATSISATYQLLAIGTSDGCVFLYGTSPTLGWASCKAYRAFPAFVLGSPIVEISINRSSLIDKTDSTCEMVVVTSDGNFSVYKLSSGTPKLSYKGSIIPAMQHMHLSFNYQSTNSSAQPKLARIQITDSNKLMLILVIPMKSSGGRSLQGFIYNQQMELWMRISDSNNFVMSDFYSSLGSANGEDGLLAKMDGMVKSSASAIASAKQMYQKVAASSENSNTSQSIITRSHCEDRMACSIALGSSSEFQTWLRYYSRCLVSVAGGGEHLRFLVDILLDDQSFSMDDGEERSPIQSFLSVGKVLLGLDGKDLVSKYILPEMSKNRSLQRLTNEISMELTG